MVTCGVPPIRVLNLITGLGCGGAETVLSRLVAAVDRGRILPSVMSLTTDQPLGESIRAAGIRVESLNMGGIADLPRAVGAVRRAIERDRPHLVQTWLYHADLVGTLATWGMDRVALAWNLRCSDMDLGWSSRLVRRACAALSHRPQLVIANAATGLDDHRRLGYAPQASRVLPNGIDTARFRPDPRARTAMRAGWGFEPHRVVIGMAARWHAQKDHACFVQAAAALATRQPVAFVLAGKGLDEQAPAMRDLLARHPVAAPVKLLGLRDDLPAVDAALDIGTLSSAYGEGMPNAVAEIMACGVPCVVTDVGDSARLVGDDALVVPRRDPQALAAAWERLVLAGPDARRRQGEAARSRIEAEYSLARMVAAYESTWIELAESCATRTSCLPPG